MKKKVFFLILILVLPIFISLVGCSSNSSTNSSKGQLTEEQKKFIFVGEFDTGSNYVNIYVNKATKVMYLIDKDGAITVMLNPDGSPQIYQGEL